MFFFEWKKKKKERDSRNFGINEGGVLRWWNFCADYSTSSRNLSGLKTRAIIRGNNALENTVPSPSYRIAKEGHPSESERAWDTRGFCSDSSLLVRTLTLVFPKVISRSDRVREWNELWHERYQTWWCFEVYRVIWQNPVTWKSMHLNNAIDN